MPNQRLRKPLICILVEVFVQEMNDPKNERLAIILGIDPAAVAN